MNIEQTRALIEAAFADIAAISPETGGDIRAAVDAVLTGLDNGALRIAEQTGGADNHGWHVHEWLKKAILLSFRLNDMAFQPGGPQGGGWWDKLPSKFAGWQAEDFDRAGFRAVPDCVVRRSAHISRGVVLMPCFVNLGAYVGEGSMIDTWATVGSCAQIGKRVHISGGAGIGGVLEPLQANPVIIEDDCFIGARSEVAEGVIVGEGAVLAMGVFLSASTAIVERASGAMHRGYVPPFSVVVPGVLPPKSSADNPAGVSLACAVIVKTVDARTRAKTSINELLREG